jgi:hypothetical protein
VNRQSTQALIKVRSIEKHTEIVAKILTDEQLLFLLHGFETVLLDLFMTVAENPAMLSKIEKPQTVLSPFLSDQQLTHFVRSLKKRLIDYGGGLAFDETLSESETQSISTKILAVLPPQTRKVPLSEFPPIKLHMQSLLRSTMKSLAQSVATIASSKYIDAIRQAAEIEIKLDIERKQKQRMLAGAVDDVVALKQKIRILEEQLKYERTGKEQALSERKIIIKSAAQPIPEAKMFDEQAYVDEETRSLIDRLVTAKLLGLIDNGDEINHFRKHIESLKKSLQETESERKQMELTVEERDREISQLKFRNNELEVSLEYKAKDLSEKARAREIFQKALRLQIYDRLSVEHQIELIVDQIIGTSEDILVTSSPETAAEDSPAPVARALLMETLEFVAISGHSTQHSIPQPVFYDEKVKDTVHLKFESTSLTVLQAKFTNSETAPINTDVTKQPISNLSPEPNEKPALRTQNSTLIFATEQLDEVSNGAPPAQQQQQPQNKYCPILTILQSDQWQIVPDTVEMVDAEVEIQVMESLLAQTEATQALQTAELREMEDETDFRPQMEQMLAATENKVAILKAAIKSVGKLTKKQMERVFVAVNKPYLTPEDIKSTFSHFVESSAIPKHATTVRRRRKITGSLFRKTHTVSSLNI